MAILSFRIINDNQFATRIYWTKSFAPSKYATTYLSDLSPQGEYILSNKLMSYENFDIMLRGLKSALITHRMA